MNVKALSARFSIIIIIGLFDVNFVRKRVGSNI